MGARRTLNERRICLALLTDAFGGRGGIAQYNRDLTTALARDPSFASIEILPRVAPDDLGSLPAKVRQHKPRLGRLSYVLAAWRLASQLKPHVVFCGHLFMVPLGVTIARAFGARLVVQVHGVEAWTRPQWPLRRALERADLILAVSRDTRARVLAWADIVPERVRVASNTVAADFTPGDRAAARAALGLYDEFVLLTVGRLAASERYKGHDRIIPALKPLLEAGMNPIYLIVGDGDDRPRLEALARECDVGSQVRFLGHVPRDALPNLYRAAQIFVLPSLGEGFGIVLLEAMACGTPAVGLAHGGAMDALCDGELGVALEVDDVRAGLIRVCSASYAGQLEAGEALAHKVDERFGRSAFERRVDGLFAEVHRD
jgi:phosphatidylinositol alpha-1,6-mannosyltransferase